MALVGAPQVAGADVLYTESRAKGNVVLRSARPGGPASDIAAGLNRRVCDPDDEDTCDVDRFDFDASGGRAAFSKSSRHDLANKPPSYGLATGPLAGPFETIVACAQRSPFRRYALEDNRRYDLDGDAIAYAVESCTDGQPGVRIVTRDLGPGAAAPRTFTVSDDEGTSDGLSQVVLAGKYIAVVEFSGQGGFNPVEVFDRTTGARIYSVRFKGNVFVFDIQSDGTIVAVQGGAWTGPPLPGRTRPTRCGSFYQWASIAAPTPHQLTTCGDDYVRIEGDRVFFRRTDGRTAQITASDLSNNLTTIASFKPESLLASPPSAPGLSFAFDVEGSRIAYAVTRCLGETIYVEDVPPAAAVADETVACPASISKKAVKVSKKGKASITIKCPQGCKGSLGLVVPRPNGGIKLTVVEYMPIRIQSGTKKVSVQLTAKARKVLARAGKLRVDARLSAPAFGDEQKLTLKRG